MNEFELNFKMSDEEMERIREILAKDKGLRHYLLKLSDNQELDVVEYKEYENLQQRVDKAIVKLASISSDDLKDIKIMVKKLKDIRSILQGEEVKDNE